MDAKATVERPETKQTFTIRMAGWLVFNGTFSTKRLYRAMQKVKVC